MNEKLNRIGFKYPIMEYLSIYYYNITNIYEKK